MKTTIGKVFAVENAIKQLAGLKAAKLCYCLHRNAAKTSEITRPAAEQCKPSCEAVNSARLSGKTDDLTEDQLAEYKKIEETEKELLSMETEIEWYQIKLKDVPGMKDTDDPEKGELPLAFFTLFLDMGIIDDSEV